MKDNQLTAQQMQQKQAAKRVKTLAQGYDLAAKQYQQDGVHTRGLEYKREFSDGNDLIFSIYPNSDPSKKYFFII